MVYFKKICLVSSILMIVTSVSVGYGEEAPAGIYGWCFYCNPQGIPIAYACSVSLYLKRQHDGQVFTGNSARNDTRFYVAQQSYSVDVYIPAGTGFYYYVKGYKYNTSGPYAGTWVMEYVGPYPYEFPTQSNPPCHIYLRKIPGTEPQGGNE